MKISVLIPTYRRPHDLEKGLRSLSRQRRRADEIIVVYRDVDPEALRVIESLRGELPMLVPVEVRAPGQVAALNQGLERYSGDIVAITDDDTVLDPDWLEKIVGYFDSDPRIGAVGGRDRVHENGTVIEARAPRVGLLQWFGRPTGNHHIGIGGPREVDFLKGANMSFRRQAIAGLRFDTRLRGRGAQVSNDMMFCLNVKKRGWKLLYDPAVSLDHYPAPRPAGDDRREVSREAQSEISFNEVLTIGSYLPFPRKLVYLAYAILVGNTRVPGLLQFPRFARKKGSLGKIAGSLTGIFAAYAALLS